MMRDLCGNLIYSCPRCGLEYTVAPAYANFTFHCEVTTCRYTVLEPTRKQKVGDTLLDDRMDTASHTGGGR